MRRLYIEITDREAERKLYERAHQNRRDPRDEAALIVERALLRRPTWKPGRREPESERCQ
jgi:hypothetical protein